MVSPEVWNVADLKKARLGNADVWCLDHWAPKVQARLGTRILSHRDEPDGSIDTLVVVGGGALIDRAKIWRQEHNRAIRLIAIPVVWGSGAENSPVAVASHNGKKTIYVGEDYLPDIRVVWPELAEDISPERLRQAIGDVWAHALEGFLSPLASDPLRRELAKAIETILSLPLEYHPDWFEVSAQACNAQSRSSVGLVHGIAHTIEGPLRKRFPQKRLGHAALCSVYLWPVLSFNMHNSDKVAELFGAYGLDQHAVLRSTKTLYDSELYLNFLPALEQHWRLILRDPMTRTNCTLVRASHLSFFTERAFP
jgi:alcohol dehydrogenase class IV